MLAIQNLLSCIDGKDILKGSSTCRSNAGRGARHHGSQRLGQVDAVEACSPATRTTRSPKVSVDVRGLADLAGTRLPRSAPPRASSSASSTRWKSPAYRTYGVPQPGRAQRPAQAARRVRNWMRRTSSPGSPIASSPPTMPPTVMLARPTSSVAALDLDLENAVGDLARQHEAENQYDGAATVRVSAAATTCS